ncbi:thioredoxin, partial [Salmonella enterica subsp. enterica serovar Paratyphi B]|nr:thioredoxin [Salmonella enterica subsp. enterica serovar Paratyphi B]
VTYEQVSPVLYDAILSSEDKSFYTHGGVNLGATMKALIDNVRGTSSRGASTISQQFVKNVLIQQCEQDVDTTSDTYSDDLQQCWLDATNAVGSKGIERKLQEMRYAIQIEKDFSKNDILLGYLNIANFGGTVYGIEAAARYYFSTTAMNLTVGQAATL